jgi:hypothetical protein
MTAAVFISTLPLIVSLLTLYLNLLKPFRIKVFNAGRFELSIADSNISQRSLTLFLGIINTGVRPGIFENLYAVVTYPNKRKVFLFPKYLISEGAVDLNRGTKSLTVIPFTSFSIA